MSQFLKNLHCRCPHDQEVCLCLERFSLRSLSPVKLILVPQMPAVWTIGQNADSAKYCSVQTVPEALKCCLFKHAQCNPVLCIQKASKEPILEEAELDFKPLEECEEGLEEEDSQPKETKETEPEAKKEAEHKGHFQ